MKRLAVILMSISLIATSIIVIDDNKCAYANESSSMSMSLQLTGFSTYQNNNYVFELENNNKYLDATSMWEECIKNGFSFCLDSPLNNLNLLQISIGTRSNAKGKFTIGNESFGLNLIFLGGTEQADWIFKEVEPDIYYYEAFCSKDGKTKIVINNKDALADVGTNFKQIFLLGMKNEKGSIVKSKLEYSTDIASYYSLSAIVGNETYEYSAVIAKECQHKATSWITKNEYSTIKDYLKKQGYENDDYAVEMCNTCKEVLNISKIEDSGYNKEESTTYIDTTKEDVTTQPIVTEEETTTQPIVTKEETTQSITTNKPTVSKVNVSNKNSKFNKKIKISFLKSIKKVKKKHKVDIKYRISGAKATSIKIYLSNKKRLKILNKNKKKVTVKGLTKGKVTLTLKVGNTRKSIKLRVY